MHPILSRIQAFVKSHFHDILIYIIVVLLLMLAFAAGFLVAKQSLKTPFIIEQPAA